MKKVLMFASAAIAALAMVSCNKEIEIQDKMSEGICPDGYYLEELVATYPSDPATKTAFNETNGKFAWTEGDELAFHLSNGTYTSAAIDPATSKVKLYLPVGVTRDNYAVYPASAVVDEAAEIGNMQVTLPSTYDISDNLTTEFVPMPLIATNDAENKNLKFEHVGALLQVNLKVPAGVKTAKLSMGKTITGTFSLSAGSGNGIIEAGAVSDDALTFVLSEDGLTAESTTVKLLAPLPSGIYDKFEVTYDNGFAFTKDLSSKPWKFDRTQGKKVSIADENFEDPTNYFWFEALEAGSTVTLKFSGSKPYGGNLIINNPPEYSFDKKEWTKYDFSSTGDIVLNNVGDRVYFRGYCNYTPYVVAGYSYRAHHVYFSGSGKLKTGGDIMTLKKYNDNPSGTFPRLFSNMTCLVDASELILPDYVLDSMYDGTFNGCESLEKAPNLPATTMKKNCYNDMFAGCSSLVSAPELPATVLAQHCYSGMFYGCSTLTYSPELPVDILAIGCYSGMFQDCTALISAPELPAKTLPTSCYFKMFDGCSSLISIPDIEVNCVTGEEAMKWMFRHCKSLTKTSRIYLNFDENSLESSESVCDAMFLGCSNLSDASGVVFNCPSVGVSAFESMFGSCVALTEVPVFETSIKLSDASCRRMFSSCKLIKEYPSGFMPISVGYESCREMFSYCSSLSENIPDRLEAPVMGTGSYSAMFSNCTSLTKAPELPATVLAESCYSGMFTNCSSLTEIQDILPATELAKSCYQSMFNGCELIKKAPDLPAKTLVIYCYQNMFSNCKSLEQVKVGFTSWPANSSTDDSDYRATYEWMYGAKNKNTCQFIKPSELAVSRGNNGILSAWKLVNYDE